MHSEQEEGQEPEKQKQQFVNFQTDPNVDKNTYCRLCNMIFTSPVVAQSHYLGKIHAKKLRQLSADQAHQHSTPSTEPEPGKDAVVYMSTLLADKFSSWSSGTEGLSLTSAVPELGSEKISQDAENPSVSSSAPSNLDTSEKYCRLCFVSFNNPLMAHQHYVGKKHKRNEARKKLMAEIGPEAIPGESKASVGAGSYICPICSISLTSIEMYQSHMNGNKHQMKKVSLGHRVSTSTISSPWQDDRHWTKHESEWDREATIVNLMKKAKKTYSFQDELEDYIKVQKARGLEPKTNFRKPEEEFQREEFEALCGQEETIAFDRDQFSHETYEPDQHSFFFAGTCAPPYTAEKGLPCWSPTLEDPVKLENAPLSQLSIEPCSEKERSLLTNRKYDYNDWSPDESLTFSDRSPNYSRRSQKTKKKKKNAGDLEENPCQQFPKPKRKRYYKEETYLSKDTQTQKEIQAAADSATEWKSKHGKDKGNKCRFSEKESRKHKKEKKKAKVSGPTDEETLWNESVLGF